MADTWGSLMSKYMNATKDTTFIIAKEMSELLKENLYDMWYMKNPEKSYVRTYELLNSIYVKPKVERVGSGYVATVSFDDGKLSRGRQESGWTQHSSMIDGRDISGESLAYILDQGAKTPFKDFVGVNYVEATVNGISKIRGRVEKQMKVIGYDVKVYF